MSAHREPGRGRCFRTSGRLETQERAHVGAQVVVLPRHAGLELRQLLEGLRAPTSPQELTTGLHAQVHARERLRIAVVQRASESMESGLEDATLTAECADQIPGDREVHGPGDVKAQALRPGD